MPVTGEEATKSKGGGTLLHLSDCLLQKLHSYGKALNLRGVMAPWPPYGQYNWLIVMYKGKQHKRTDKQAAYMIYYQVILCCPPVQYVLTMFR